MLVSPTMWEKLLGKFVPVILRVAEGGRLELTEIVGAGGPHIRPVSPGRGGAGAGPPKWAMTAITTSSSTKVNAAGRGRRVILANPRAFGTGLQTNSDNSAGNRHPP